MIPALVSLAVALLVTRGYIWLSDHQREAEDPGWDAFVEDHKRFMADLEKPEPEVYLDDKMVEVYCSAAAIVAGSGIESDDMGLHRVAYFISNDKGRERIGNGE